MRDDASLRRLAELGIDVYLPRAERVIEPESAAPAPTPARTDPSMAPTPSPRADVLVIAQLPTPEARGLLADVERALTFAGVGCAIAERVDTVAVEKVAALVVFGELQARTIGAQLPAQRQREIGWVVAGEAAAVAGDAQAKRALWSELRRITRALAARLDVARR